MKFNKQFKNICFSLSLTCTMYLSCTVNVNEANTYFEINLFPITLEK
ncbi:hypothetical protein [Paraclostridium bifermentans]